MPSFQESPSARALAETPVKALTFMGAVSSNASIREALAPLGFTQAVQERYWRLLHDAMDQQALVKPSGDEQVRLAVATVDAWDEPTFKLARAALHFDFPDAFAFVFNGLEPATGVGALVSVTRFLDRLDDLERAPERKTTRKVDQAALAKLAERGITPDERARMRRLVKVAERSAAPEPTEASAASPESADALVRLKAMYDEWVEVARVAVTRRADLIRLGILRRRRPTRGNEAPDAEPDSPPQPVVTALPVAAAPPPLVVAAPSLPSPTNGLGVSSSNGVPVVAPLAPLPS